MNRELSPDLNNGRTRLSAIFIFFGSRETKYNIGAFTRNSYECAKENMSLSCLLMSRTKTNRRTDREQYTRSNAATARLLTLVRPAETLARD